MTRTNAVGQSATAWRQPTPPVPPGPLAAHEALRRLGTAKMTALVALLVVFVVLNLIRLPLVLTVRILSAAMLRLDAYLTGQLTAGTTVPAIAREQVNAHAAAA